MLLFGKILVDKDEEIKGKIVVQTATEIFKANSPVMEFQLKAHQIVINLIGR